MLGSNVASATGVERMPKRLDFIRNNSVDAGIIWCGTSRIIVLDGSYFDESVNLEKEIEFLLIGNSRISGLAGTHYQLNKVALVWKDQSKSGFKFRFYQLDSKTKELIPNLECANLSAGAGLFCAVRNMVKLSKKKSLRALNLGTNQKIELKPHPLKKGNIQDWSVKFLIDPGKKLTVVPEILQVRDSYNELVELEYWMAMGGNVFIFVNADPEIATPELGEYFTEKGKEFGISSGVETTRANMPKVIFYSFKTFDVSNPLISASCFFKGEIHKSLPGSGSMCLARFLAENYLTENQPSADFGTMKFTLSHPSGEIEVKAKWIKKEAEYLITSTQFTTQVRMFFFGEFFISN